MGTIYTIGHSTRRVEEFTGTLRAHSIQAVIDIRAFPGSRRFPHFNRQSLENVLRAEGFEYRWLEALGGRRPRTLEVSPNPALRNASFRNYADHMLTPEFKKAAGDLIEIAGQWRAAIMCAERLYFRCHRMLVSDWLLAHGHEVLHIDDARPPAAHKLLPEAQIVNGQLLYRGNLLI